MQLCFTDLNWPCACVRSVFCNERSEKYVFHTVADMRDILDFGGFRALGLGRFTNSNQVEVWLFMATRD